MKRVGKPTAIVVAVVCIAVFALSFFGISSRYGDVVTKTIYNIADLDRGLGFGFEATSVLESTEDASPETLEQAKNGLEARLDLMSVADYDVAIDSENGSLILRTAFTENSGYSPYQVANFLAAKGDFTVRVGAEQNEDGSMAGITADDASIILSNEDIKSVVSSYTIYTNIPYYIISVELDRDAATDYANAVQKLIDDGIYSELSYWIDDVMFYSEPLTEISNTSHLSISSNSWSSAQATAYALYLQSEPLPMELEFKSSFVDQEAGFGANAALAMGIGAAVLLVAAFVYLVVRFKMFGLSAFLCMLGALGATAMVYTGVFRLSYNVNLTVSSFAAFVAIVIVSVERATRSGSAMVAAMNTGASAGKAAADVLTGKLFKNILGLAPLFFGGLFVHFSFGSGNFLARAAAALSGGADVGTIAGLGLGIAMAALFSLVFSVIGLGLMVRSLCTYKAFADVKCFGGKEND